jgi:serine/threonine protein kinase
VRPSDQQIAHVVTSNRFVKESDLEEVRTWGKRYHPEKDLAELLFMKGLIDRAKVSLVRRMAKMASGSQRRRSSRRGGEVGSGSGSESFASGSEPFTSGSEPLASGSDPLASDSALVNSSPPSEDNSGKPRDTATGLVTGAVKLEVEGAETQVVSEQASPSPPPPKAGAKASAKPSPKPSPTETAKADPVDEAAAAQAKKDEAAARKERRRKKRASDPETVGRYEILERVAQGGMGIVYKARHPDLDRVFALKVLTGRVKGSGEALLRFQREAKAAARLDHPNVVRVYDAGTSDEDAPYLVMDYVDGPDLDDLIKEEGLGVRKAAQLTLSIAKALQHAHDKGLVHRDIKPENIIIERSTGKPKITDFGIVKELQEDTQDAKLTQTGFTLGSPCYMSPEQAAGRHDLVGPGSDIYSLAATLYEMLTGEPPFDGESIHEIMTKVVRDDPVPARNKNQAIPRDLDVICMKALEKEVERRYATAEEFAEDLRRYLEDEPIQAKPVGVITRSLRVVRRHRAVSALCLVFALVLTGLGTSVWRTDRERQRRELSERETRYQQARSLLLRAENADDPVAMRRLYYEALLILESVLDQDPDHEGARAAKQELVLALGDHLIESGETSFAEFVFGLGKGVADAAVIASRVEMARSQNWLESAEEKERQGRFEDALVLYRQGLRSLEAAGYDGDRLADKVADLEVAIELRQLQAQLVSLKALGENSAAKGDHAAAYQTYSRALDLAPGDQDLAGKVQHHLRKAQEEVLTLRTQAQERRTRVRVALGDAAASAGLEELLGRGDEALTQGTRAQEVADFALAGHEYQRAEATYGQAYHLATALRARGNMEDAAREAEDNQASRFAQREIARAQDFQARGLSAVERGDYEQATDLFERAASEFRRAVSTGSGKEAVHEARSLAQTTRSRADSELRQDQRMVNYTRAEEDYEQAEALYRRGEYAQAEGLYGQAYERYQEVIRLAPATREAFSARVRVRSLKLECEQQRADLFDAETLERARRAEREGDDALARLDPASAAQSYADAVYRYGRALERALPQAEDMRECAALRDQAQLLQAAIEERGLSWKPAYQEGREQLEEGNQYFEEQHWRSARRRYNRALQEFGKVDLE